jgi:hypothetical protein
VYLIVASKKRLWKFLGSVGALIFFSGIAAALLTGERQMWLGISYLGFLGIGAAFIAWTWANRSPFLVLSVGFGLASMSGITVFFGSGEELELMWQIGFGVFLAGLVWAMFRIFNDQEHS